MSNFSKGSWKCLNGELGVYDENGMWVKDIANFVYYGSPYMVYSSKVDYLSEATEETLANARLIESAPTMYQLLLDLYEHELKHYTIDNIRMERMCKLFDYVELGKKA